SWKFNKGVCRIRSFINRSLNIFFHLGIVGVENTVLDSPRIELSLNNSLCQRFVLKNSPVFLRGTLRK
ncbi:hypothetical protein PENTCL1PPCAC_8105, partial [Pristionchus entomophagus]